MLGGHEEGDGGVVGLDEPDGLLREEQVVVLARVVSAVTRHVCAPEVGVALALHVEERGGAVAVGAVRAAGLCSQRRSTLSVGNSTSRPLLHSPARQSRTGGASGFAIPCQQCWPGAVLLGPFE